MTQPRDFWSRRKAGVQAEAETERAMIEAEAIAGKQAELEEKTDAEILSELDLPDPDSLQPGDDVSGFMAKAVPDRLRRRALRKLWRLNPVLANVDGLVDYGEDYTDAACVIENLQSAYTVGKGMVAHIEHLAATAEADADTETLAADTVDDPPEPDEAAPAAAPDTPDQPDNDLMAAAPESEVTDPAPRRMRFEFEG